jgi:hypothetical protein
MTFGLLTFYLLAKLRLFTRQSQVGLPRCKGVVGGGRPALAAARTRFAAMMSTPPHLPLCPDAPADATRATLPRWCCAWRRWALPCSSP